MTNSFENTIKFIKESFGNRDFTALHEPVFFGNEKKYLNNAIDSTFVSSVGEYVNQFESEFAKVTNTKRAIAVVNGTAALQVGLRLCGVKSGEEVITQALTFVATANAISYLNATPVFVDVDRDTMGLSPTALESFLNELGELREDGTYNKKTGKRISACVPMHTFGFMCKIDEIVNICNKWNIEVVEDAAEALGSKFKGGNAGSFGKVGAFSFNGNKIITAGGGGSIVTNENDIADKAKYLTTTAKIPHKWEYAHDEMGYNYRMPNINAALICAQLENLNKIKENKAQLYSEYDNFFNGKGLELVKIPKDTDWNYWLMSLKFNDKKERDLFLDESNSNAIMTRPIWQLMYRLPMYKDCQRDAQINAEFLEERIVNIPSGARI